MNLLNAQLKVLSGGILQTRRHKATPYSPDVGNLAGRMSNYQRLSGLFLRSSPPVHLLSEMPGNIGDHLIWRGTENLLQAEGIDFRRVTVDEVRSGARERSAGTLVVPGSGALTRHWHEWLPATIEAASSLFEKVVVLPSEYDTGVSEVRDALSQPNVFAFAREAESYGLVKAYGRAALGLDPALWAFNGFETNHDRGVRSSDGTVLLALRTDAGSSLGLSRAQASAENNDISVTSASLEDFLETVVGCETVVSDRLHVVVAGVMLGKSVKYIDPWNEKISRYVRFNFRTEFGDRLVPIDIEWLMNNGYVDPIEGADGT